MSVPIPISVWFSHVAFFGFRFKLKQKQKQKNKQNLYIVSITITYLAQKQGTTVQSYHVPTYYIYIYALHPPPSPKKEIK
jgi:hypothetical protein